MGTTDYLTHTDFGTLASASSVPLAQEHSLNQQVETKIRRRARRDDECETEDMPIEVFDHRFDDLA